MVIQASNTQVADVHMLLIDDDMFILHMLKQLFQRESYHVTCAEDSEKALELLSTQTFDIVLMDLMLPEINGLEMLQRIRQDKHLSELPVILISGVTDTDYLVQCLEQGANDYITKPLEIPVVLARIKTQIALKKERDKNNSIISDLQSVHKLRSRIIRAISHDLKNPFTNIRMAEYLLRQQVVSDDNENGRLLDTISQSLEAMQMVLNQFFEIPDIRSDKIVIDMQPVDLEQLVWDTVTQYGIAAYNKEIFIDVADINARVMADPPRLRQIVANLVSNALKYSPFNTTIKIWAVEKEGKIRLCVADQGPGIPADERHLLFKEYTQLSPRPTGGESSTGLGLWIVRHFVELQHGEVGADSPPTGGSIFWFELPAAADTKAIPDAQATPKTELQAVVS